MESPSSEIGLRGLRTLTNIYSKAENVFLEPGELLMIAANQPFNFKEAVTSKAWKEAMQTKLKQPILQLKIFNCSMFGCFCSKNCITWMGPKPILHITDPTMIREMLGKYEDYQKAKGPDMLLTLL
ncbi:unnamed protein product [Lactuca saligna]|uniref:Uncharacterized protein n=1 Tax=Lactuca saligna TaxID=75948 RepID=A0AA35YK46_LACSI|nr:unnamed protein product [Lactuca saligna]